MMRRAMVGHCQRDIGMLQQEILEVHGTLNEERRDVGDLIMRCYVELNSPASRKDHPLLLLWCSKASFSKTEKWERSKPFIYSKTVSSDGRELHTNAACSSLASYRVAKLVRTHYRTSGASHSTLIHFSNAINHQTVNNKLLLHRGQHIATGAISSQASSAVVFASM